MKHALRIRGHHTRPFLLLVVLASLVGGVLAEDADRRRGYLHFRSGEFDTAWDVHDYWGLSLGMNFDQHWGAELAGDVFEHYLSYGEVSVNSFMPQARFRYPLLKNRLVPYLLVGAGGAFMQFNDKKAKDQAIHGEAWKPALAAGVGIDYFLSDNVAFAVEGKYFWGESLDLTVDGRSQSFNPSTFLATIGLRAYFDENHTRPLAEQEEEVPSRLSFGVRYGGSILTDGRVGAGLKLQPEAAAYWDTLNQFASLSVGANFGEHWGVDLLLGGFEPRLYDENLGTLGEYALVSVLPLVRFRAPLAGGRWVPYLTAGIGTTYGEFNDSHHVATVEAKGFYPTAAIGGGVEYFIDRNLSLTADFWWQSSWGHTFRINGEGRQGDFSSFQMQIGIRIYLLETKPRKSASPHR